MMKIKNIYCLSGDEYHDLIETPDGKLYTFHIVPFRPLMQRDLTPVNTQPPTAYVPQGRPCVPAHGKLSSGPVRSGAGKSFPHAG